MPVFDVSQTDPLPGTEPVPHSPPAQPIEGDSHTDLIAPLRELGRELGYRVEIRDLPEHGPGGWCDDKHKQIDTFRYPEPEPALRDLLGR